MDSEKLVWTAFALIFGIIILKFVYWRINRGMAELQRLAEDPEFRKEKLADLEAYLNENPGDTDARLRRADLWRREGDFSRAASDLRLYLQMKPEDAEGWAELAECAIVLQDKHEALAAAEKARGLDPAYADYCALNLRAHLLAGNLEAAQLDWQRWAELDRQRCLCPEAPRSWFSPPRQLPPAEVVEDPALAVYQAALLLRQGEREKAREKLAPVRAENPDYLEEVLRLDPLLKEIAALEEKA